MTTYRIAHTDGLYTLLTGDKLDIDSITGAVRVYVEDALIGYVPGAHVRSLTVDAREQVSV